MKRHSINIYAVAAFCRKDNSIFLGVMRVLAENPDEALDMAKKDMEISHPQDQGYHDHELTVSQAIPLEWIKYVAENNNE